VRTWSGEELNAHDLHLVFLNGLIVGVHLDPVKFVTNLRNLRRRGLVGEFVSLLHDADVAEFLQHALGTKDTSLTREFVLDANAGPVILNFSLMPLVQGGLVQGTMLLAQDVSERKNKEAQLRRAESLASLTTLAAGVAHEIKNPLASMGIHIQLLQRVLEGQGAEFPLYRHRIP
jgi:signal transduction histidine kinase